MKPFTVIGYYSDTYLRYVTHVEAEDAHDATVVVADMYPDESISIVSVIAGYHQDLLEGDYPEDTDDIREAEEE